MKRITIRKTFRYDPTVNGKYSKYDGYYLIGKQEVDPEIVAAPQLKKFNETQVVFCSKLKRGIETALKISKDKNVIVLPELNEVRFDLGTLVNINEYDKYGSYLVRKRFINAFIENNLLETREDIEIRIEKLFKLLKNFPDGNYLMISHSFIMKILQIYIKDRNLFKKPEMIRKYFDVNNRTYEFGTGFEFNLL
jgi:hypothetical protein